MEVRFPVFGPEEITLLKSILEEAIALLPNSQRTSAFQALLAQNIVMCAATGERDRHRLRAAALKGCADSMEPRRYCAKDALQKSW